MNQTALPSPGSPEARALGCTCEWQGSTGPMTNGVWYRIRSDCPIHMRTTSDTPLPPYQTGKEGK